MDTVDVKKVLNAVGVGSIVLGIGLIAYASVTMYKSYLQTELLKLQINDLNNRLRNPNLGPTQPIIPTE